MAIYRIEIATLPKWRDARAEKLGRQIKDVFGIEPGEIRTRSIYTLDADITLDEAESLAKLLCNPVLDSYFVSGRMSSGYAPLPPFSSMAVIGFRPGVTDNVARTLRAAASDVLGRRLSEKDIVASSVEYVFMDKSVDTSVAEKIGSKLIANLLIQTLTVVGYDEFCKNGAPVIVPRPGDTGEIGAKIVDLSVSDEKLMEISRTGTLSLSLDEMKSIQNYFHNAPDRAKYGLTNEPTDLELEVIAQTWSEHCKHKIFSAEIDYSDLEKGTETHISNCYKSFIQKSTKELSKEVGYLVSVFKDNAGVIDFNSDCDIAFKVETHNSPSALDPYGGAMTGIVGVNRDPMGTGQGAELMVNVWGYCFGSPFCSDDKVPEGLLHPRRLRDGVHQGVIDGGNQSGIPYGNGWEYFDDRYIGKPLVYCGTLGKLPKKINGVPGHYKTILPGDLIVMAGGRIGKDGIHGATFSSEELHKDSPVQAVQIGDPITQKKMSDFMMEARDRGLYRFVTDNGAGGLSSSVGEMAEECGGCRIDLAKAPLKYAGLQPWEILVSEAQERMSFAVAPDKIEEFKKLAAERDVEVSVLGEFTDDGMFHVMYGDKTCGCISIEYMHTGLPKMHLKAVWKAPRWPEVECSGRDMSADLLAMMGRLNIASGEFKARQYDHEVKGLSVVKPYVGKCRDVASDACVLMIEPLSTEGVVLTSAILPRYSDIDTYWMTADSIDLAVRRVLAVGGSMSRIAGLDNFCWPDPVRSEKTPDGEYKLAQLVRANQALHDFTKFFKVPCISGKDSMKNDSTRGGRKISIPPSLLFSVVAKMDDIRLAVTLDFKNPGDIIYVLGKTADELGGSEYFNMLGGLGNNVPKVDPESAIKLYTKVIEATRLGLVDAMIAPGFGGVAVALGKMAIGGRLGADVDLSAMPGAKGLDSAAQMFSESSSRFVATVPPEKQTEFERIMAGTDFAVIGKVTNGDKLSLGPATVSVDDLVTSYKKTLDRI
ncbi:MAG: AIR synthase-related protein [Victivallaceae bacterium]|nr:AIR synthase-related protein [Victivallaceae bacterium]